MITRLRQNDTVRLLALLLVVTLLALPVLTYPLGRDQGEFAAIGRGLLAGQVPYRDLWNPKPPAIFYIYAGTMALFGQSSAALRLLDVVMVPLVAVALFWLGRQFVSGRVGLWAALLFSVFYFTETFWTLTQNDGLVLLPMVLAVVSMVQAAHGTNQLKIEKEGDSRTVPTDLRPTVAQFSWAFLSGALCGVVVWFKYPFALLGVVVAVGYVLLTPLPAANVSRFTRLRDEFKTRLGVGLMFLLGGLVVLAGGALYLAAIGAWDSFLESARVTAGYTSLTFNWNDFRDLMTTALGFRWAQWGLLLVLAALWFVLPRFRVPLSDVPVNAQTENNQSKAPLHTMERGS
ncbi:MAG TPA: glycosyltransferase family 39 protein, partial [Phototrophicaceae bacterium]|nr:glycosyltransferase family 39 protein [Phototrophicaceae bacterium]